jgi:Short C-terminal domain/Phospholipase_D-nuclease N-terminal
MPMLATDYPLLNLFWTVLYIFFFVIWIWVLISVLIDVFRSHDLSGWAKALWLVFIVFLPLLGVLVYVIARGDKMQEHAVHDARAQDAALKQYVQQAAGTTSTADELTKLADLRDRGVLTEEQFEAQKAKLLA